MASCSAIRTGLSSIGRMLPSSRIFARRVVRASTAAVMFTPTFTHEGVEWCSLIMRPSNPAWSANSYSVEIALVVRGGLLRVEEAVGELEPERRVLVALLVRELVVRHLAEVVELHRRGSPPRKSRTSRAKRSGCSIGGRWPQRSSTVRVAAAGAAILLAALDGHDPVLAAPDDQRAIGHPRQEVGEPGVVHVRLPRQACGHLTIARRDLDLGGRRRRDRRARPTPGRSSDRAPSS